MVCSSRALAARIVLFKRERRCMFVALQLTEEGKVEQAVGLASRVRGKSPAARSRHPALQHAALIATGPEFVAIADLPFLDTHVRTMGDFPFEHYVAVMMAHLTQEDPPPRARPPCASHCAQA